LGLWLRGADDLGIRFSNVTHIVLRVAGLPMFGTNVEPVPGLLQICRPPLAPTPIANNVIVRSEILILIHRSSCITI